MPPKRHRAPLVLVVVVATVAGCGDGGASRTTAATATSRSEGRPIAGAQGPSVEALATAVRFAQGYLDFQAGRIEADQVPDATPELRRGLKHLRVPPTSRKRRVRIAAAQLQRIDAHSARITVQVRNVDEQLTYPLPIDLVRRGGEWAALATGDDA